MELLAFNTEGVEYKLYDIMSAFQALIFAVNGLKNMNLIKENELSGFEYIIRDACNKTDALIQGMKPVLVGNDRRIVLVFGENEPSGNICEQ